MLPTNDPHQMLFKFLDTASSLVRQLDTALSNLAGISYSEYKILRALSLASQHRATRIALAQQVGLTPSAVTRALKPLEKIGLVSAEKGERDARQSLAILSPSGSKRLNQAQSLIDDMSRDLPLTLLDAQQQSLLTTLLDELRVWGSQG